MATGWDWDPIQPLYGKNKLHLSWIGGLYGPWKTWKISFSGPGKSWKINVLLISRSVTTGARARTMQDRDKSHKTVWMVCILMDTRILYVELSWVKNYLNTRNVLKNFQKWKLNLWSQKTWKLQGKSRGKSWNLNSSKGYKPCELCSCRLCCL